MTRKVYPSDITRKQFELIRLDLEEYKKSTRPRLYDLYDIFCATLYYLKTGCQWRALPSDFPPWKSVNYYFGIWSQVPEGKTESLLQEILKKTSDSSVKNLGGRRKRRS